MGTGVEQINTFAMSGPGVHGLEKWSNSSEGFSTSF